MVDEFAASTTFANGVELGGVNDLVLHHFEREPARIASRFEGQHTDGFLAGAGSMSVWPRTDIGVSGTVTFTARAPAGGPDRTIAFDPTHPGAPTPAAITVPAGTERTAVLRACTDAGRWTIDYTASPATGDGTRVVTLQASPLEYVVSRGACP